MKQLRKNILMIAVGLISSGLIFSGYVTSFNYDAKHNISLPVEMMKTAQFNAFSILPK